MSEEKLNNGNSEETAALFVSAQKKKKAEEEAKRKAQEEKAAREAAEAEVRRLEQEVEERKRKAEEESGLFGKAKKQKRRPADSGEEAGGSSPAGAGKKSKKPLFIGIGAAAFLLIAITALSGGGGESSGASSGTAVDSSLEFNQEFVAQEPAYDIGIRYPESLYPQLMEMGALDDGEYDVSFPGQSDGDIFTGVQFNDLTADTGHMVTKGLLGSISAKTIASSMEKHTKTELEKDREKVEFLSELPCDITAEDPGSYLYTCTYQFQVDEGVVMSGAASTWLEANSSGEYKYVLIFCQKMGEDTDSVSELCRLFTEENTGNALKIPGGDPPPSAEADGMLEVEALHMGIPVPEGRFERHPNTTEYMMWSDENGASIIAQYTDLEMTLDQALKSIKKNRDTWLDNFKNGLAAGGLNNFLSSVENRMFVIDHTYPADERNCAYYADYKDVVGGITCRERYYVTYWYDETEEKSYIAVLIFLAPDNNYDVYQAIFENALENLTDL